MNILDIPYQNEDETIHEVDMVWQMMCPFVYTIIDCPMTPAYLLPHRMETLAIIEHRTITKQLG